jgi:hypothetical protein
MFGSPSEGATKPGLRPSTAPTSSARSGQAQDLSSGQAQDGTGDDNSELNSANPQRDAFASGDNVDNPLQIGGIYYQQMIATGQGMESAANDTLSMPLQLDTFLDARPNDRIRGYVDARLVYDPSKDQYSNPTSGKSSYLPTAASTGVTPPAALPNNPQVVLDQAWLKFDLDHVVFITAGKQHLKWGASKIWNPTDFLTPQKLDPLQPYDLRLGANMVKFNLPWQAAGSSLYAVALLDNPQPASTLQQIGGAFRFETAGSLGEFGLDAVTRDGLNPDYGADLSMPLGPLDVYAEAALLTGDSFGVYHWNGTDLSPGANISSLYSVHQFAGPALQSSAGLNYSFAYMPNRQATLGAEYFYNELGADSGKLYPILIYLGKYQSFFYAARQYAAFYASAEGLDEAKKTSYNLSVISNLTDGSAVSRLDFSWLLMDYLTFGAFVDAHSGKAGSEFNFSLNTPALFYGSNYIPAVSRPTTPYDVGLSLRVAF